MKKLSFFVFIFIQTVFSQDFTQDSSTTQEKYPIAVLQMESNGLSEQESAILTERLRSAIVQSGRYQVIERSQMESILQEQGFQQFGCTTSECIVQAGQILGVRLMVGGTVGKIGTSYAIDVRLFDVETAEIIKAVTRNHRGEIDDLLAVMSDIAMAIANDGNEPVAVGEKAVSNEEVVNGLAEKVDQGLEQLKNDISSTAGTNIHTINGGEWSPFQLAFAYPTQLLPENVKIYGLRINIIYGKNHSVYGVDVGLLNEITHDLFGYQSGLSNQARRVYGVQEGLLNNCEILYGAQFGLINKSGETRGCQIGLINTSQELTGVQIGLFNYNPSGSGQPYLPIINIGF